MSITNYLRTIWPGDKVVIYYTNGEIESATVIHVPQGEGDTYQFVNDDTERTFILNVYASTVERIETREPKHNG